jgi:hypothetical protein
MKVAVALSLWLGLFSYACSSTSSSQVDIEPTTGPDGCNPKRYQLNGTVQEGGSCKANADCQPTCCVCSGSADGGNWWAAACVSGSCNGKQACSLSNGYFCP